MLKTVKAGFVNGVLAPPKPLDLEWALGAEQLWFAAHQQS